MNEGELYVLVFLYHENRKLLAPSVNVIGEFNNKGGGMRLSEFLHSRFAIATKCEPSVCF